MADLKKETRRIYVGGVALGGGAPILVQSMCNTDTRDVESTVSQILSLENAGCELVRVAVLDQEAAHAIKKIKERINIPLVADIHFDHRLALLCAQNGVDKIRINPGNIGSSAKVKEVADLCRANGIPIRIGVNGGSLEGHVLKKHGGPAPRALLESALYHIKFLEDAGFYDIVVSLKSSNVKTTIDAYRLLSKECDYPLHLGVTEAGTYKMGLIKSSIAMGSLLLDGIGDTIRVSLTEPPEKEIEAGFDILKATGIRMRGPEIISCPSCGRCRIDLIGTAKAVEEALKNDGRQIKVAVMGCAVNGPGEAREADIGLAGGDGCALLFKKGEIVRKIAGEDMVDELIKEINQLY